MLSPPSIVSVNRYFSKLKTKNRQEYLRLWWNKNKQEYNLKRRQKYATKKAKKQSLLEQLTHQYQTKTNYFCSCLENKYCNNCWFFDQQKNFVDYKFTPKNVGEKSLHTRSSLTTARNKEAFFFASELTKRVDKECLRLATEDKVPLKRGWNQPWFKEWLNKDKLIERYREWSIRGGKRMGNKYLSFLDVDIDKEDIPLSLQRKIRENALLKLKCLGCSYVETKKGYHVYMLSDELLPNEILYHTDKFGKRRKIGSIQSKGKYVVGFDSVNKKLVENGRWFWHIKDLEEIEEKLSNFFIEVGKEGKRPVVSASSVATEKESLKIKEEKKPTVENLNNSTQNLFKIIRQNIQAKILSKQKIPWLTDLVKVWYKNLNAKQNTVNYFLLNDYQHSEVLPNLDNGSIRSVCLIQGRKHAFFNQITI